VSFRARLPRRCARCGGSGRAGGSACPVCRGLGEVVANEKITIRIPAGVSTGSKVRVPGKGRTEEGDLYVALTVEPHPYFGREGDDILTEVPVTVAEAYLGDEIEVPTIHGPVRAKIPAGTAAGQRFRLKGFGVRSGRGADGDHYYRVTIATPGRVTDEGRKLAEKFASLYERSPRANLPSGL
ncbi:MAG: DnaJ C-terminal domain-containing protein, partial [Thermoanaerobaculia bacterium]